MDSVHVARYLKCREIAQYSNGVGNVNHLGSKLNLETFRHIGDAACHAVNIMLPQILQAICQVVTGFALVLVNWIDNG